MFNAMNTSQKNTASLKTLLAQLIRIERELDRIISEETDAYPDMSSAFFTELRELLYLRGEYHETDPPFIIEADPGLIIEIDPPLIM
jgi:hypothetical protein